MDTLRRFSCRKVMSKATTRHMSPRCHQSNSPKGVLPLPYISKAIFHQVRRVTRRSGFDFYITHKGGPIFRSALTRSALEQPPCPGQKDCLACQAGLQGWCAARNVVYKLECALCSECYIGETKKPVWAREAHGTSQSSQVQGYPEPLWWPLCH